MAVGMAGAARGFFGSELIHAGVYTHNLNITKNATWDPSQIPNALKFSQMGGLYYSYREQGYNASTAYKYAESPNNLD
jgi:hypothetical protein